MSRLTRSPLKLAIAMAIAVAWLAPCPAAGQILYGSLTGTVTDQQKAALPGVTVTATNVGTGLKLETVTDASGNYTFRNLLPGTYDLMAALEGFKETRQGGLGVSAGNAIRIDLALQLGQLAETVTVIGESALLQTEKADLNTELTARQMTSLPLNQYRNYQTLLNLVPGATPVQFQNALIDTPGQSMRTWVNGTQANANTTRIDGAVSVNLWLPHHAGYIQPAETLDTVNVQTNAFDADTGMAAGAAQTVVTKSGTNHLRGSAFWLYNGDSLNANSFFNNANAIAKTPLNRQTFGGTLGGPIIKNKLFYFGSWERFRDRRTSTATYVVPTAKMRAGDFSEVAAMYSAFRLYNPATGVNGVGREQFENFTIPSNLISSIAKGVMAYYPAVNSSRDLNSNSILDDYAQDRQVVVDRDNFDLKLTYQRTATHSIWGKFSMLDAEVVDNYILGWDEGSLGDTRVYVGAVGHTWTLSPTLVLDGNLGYNRQDQNVKAPDYGKNYGIELGIPGTNDPNDIRASGMPAFNTGLSVIGATPSWMPLFRKEINYTFSSALTKVFTKHEVRTGVDVVHFVMNHRQAENGPGLRGGLNFSGNITGASGYNALAWNQFAGFLLGLDSGFGKDFQTEDMTTSEWQNAFYIRDRWTVNQKLTVSAGLRLEYFPLMTRANSGIERLDYPTYTAILGGRGDVPTNPGVKLQEWYPEPRVGAAYRFNEKTVFRAGYGMTRNPLPWSRPLRGSFPYDTYFSKASDQFANYYLLSAGIPPVPVPDYNSGRVTLPAGVYMRSPNPGTEAFPGSGDTLDRGKIQQWNIAVERRLPGDISLEVAYVGTRTDGGYADLNVNYGEPGLGNAGLKYFAVAGTSAINDWASRTKNRYKGLQMALNRPFKNGLMLKGAYTWSQAKDMTTNGEDGWVGLTWNHPMKYNDNFAIAVFDRTHVFQLGWVYELPFLKERTDAAGKILGGWQVNGVWGWYTGTPFNIGGSNTAMNCVGCGSIFINVNGDPKPTGTAGSMTEKWYDVSLFSQPTGTGLSGFGTSKRDQFRRPAVWNVDLSLFKAFPIGRFRPELRIEAANVFNHTNWGAPVTGFTALNFMQFTPGSSESGGGASGTNAAVGPRRIQIGLRLAF